LRAAVASRDSRIRDLERQLVASREASCSPVCWTRQVSARSGSVADHIGHLVSPLHATPAQPARPPHPVSRSLSPRQVPLPLEPKVGPPRRVSPRSRSAQCSHVLSVSHTQPAPRGSRYQPPCTDFASAYLPLSKQDGGKEVCIAEEESITRSTSYEPTTASRELPTRREQPVSSKTASLLPSTAMAQSVLSPRPAAMASSLPVASSQTLSAGRYFPICGAPPRIEAAAAVAVAAHSKTKTCKDGALSQRTAAWESLAAALGTNRSSCSASSTTRCPDMSARTQDIAVPADFAGVLMEEPHREDIYSVPHVTTASSISNIGPRGGDAEDLQSSPHSSTEVSLNSLRPPPWPERLSPPPGSRMNAEEVALPVEKNKARSIETGIGSQGRRRGPGSSLRDRSKTPKEPINTRSPPKMGRVDSSSSLLLSNVQRDRALRSQRANNVPDRRAASPPRSSQSQKSSVSPPRSRASPPRDRRPNSIYSNSPPTLKAPTMRHRPEKRETGWR